MIGGARRLVTLLFAAAVLAGCSLLHRDPAIEVPIGEAALASWVVGADVERIDEGRLALTNVESLRRHAPPGQPGVPEKRLQGSSAEAVNGTGAPFEGEQLVLFLSATTDDRIVVQYAHDRRADAAAGQIGEVVASSGVTVTEILACLRQHTGADSRLEAVVAAVEEEQDDHGRTANALHQCEEGASPG